MVALSAPPQLTSPWNPRQDTALSYDERGTYPNHLASHSKKGASVDRQVVLSPALGEVDIQVTPRNATIQVNGDDRGKGSQILALPGVDR